MRAEHTQKKIPCIINIHKVTNIHKIAWVELMSVGKVKWLIVLHLRKIIYYSHAS